MLLPLPLLLLMRTPCTHAHSARKDQSRVMVWLNCAADVVDRWWHLYGDKLQALLPGQKITKPPQGAGTRWLSVRACAQWWTRVGIDRAVKALAEVAAPDGDVSRLSEKDKFVLREGLNPVLQASVGATADLSEILAEASLWAQRFHGLRAGEVHAYLVHLHRRLEQLRDAGSAYMDINLDRKIIDKARRIKDDWQQGETSIKSYQQFMQAAAGEHARAGADADDGGDGDDADADDEAAAEAEDGDAYQDPDDHDHDQDGAGDVAGAGEWFNKYKAVHERKNAGAAPSLEHQLPYLFEQVGKMADPKLALALGLLLVDDALQAAIPKYVIKVERWFKPDLLLGGIADRVFGVLLARALVLDGQDRLLQGIGEYMGRTAEAIKKYVTDNKEYQGQLRILTEPSLWQQLVQLAAERRSDALWTRATLTPLLLKWKICFAPLAVTNAHTESALKIVKAQSAQTRASATAIARVFRLGYNEDAIIEVHVPGRADDVLDGGDGEVDSDGDHPMSAAGGSGSGSGSAGSAAGSGAASSDGDGYDDLRARHPTDAADAAADRAATARRPSLRLEMAGENRSHRIFPVMPQGVRTALNKELKFNDKKKKPKQPESKDYDEDEGEGEGGNDDDDDPEADRKETEKLLQQLSYQKPGGGAASSKKRKAQFGDNDADYADGGDGDSDDVHAVRNGKRGIRGQPPRKKRRLGDAHPKKSGKEAKEDDDEEADADAPAAPGPAPRQSARTWKPSTKGIGNFQFKARPSENSSTDDKQRGKHITKSRTKDREEWSGDEDSSD